jgi:hypothetical protein
MNKWTKGVKRGQVMKKGENCIKEGGVELERKRRRKLINREADWGKEQKGEEK